MRDNDQEIIDAVIGYVMLTKSISHDAAIDILVAMAPAAFVAFVGDIPSDYRSSKDYAFK